MARGSTLTSELQPLFEWKRLWSFEPECEQDKWNRLVYLQRASKHNIEAKCRRFGIWYRGQICESNSVLYPYFDDTSTRTGFVKLARCSLATFVVIVAEKRYVVRSLGINLRILSMASLNSRLSSRSASSMTCTHICQNIDRWNM